MLRTRGLPFLLSLAIVTALLGGTSRTTCAEPPIDALNAALLTAIDGQDVARVETLLGQGAHANGRDKKGEPALIMAAYRGNLAIVNALLDHGAAVNSKARYGETALIAAISGNHPDVVRLLLAHGANVNLGKYNDAREPPLVVAAMHDPIFIQMLLEHGAQVNATTRYRETALMVAAEWGYVANVRLLLAHGANPHIRTVFGQTAFDKIHGDVERARLLIENGADPDPDSMTSQLMYAAEHCMDDSVLFLLEHGADVTRRDSRGETVLMHLARVREDDEFIEREQERRAALVGVLAARGADVKAVSRGGYTALMLAAERYQPGVVRGLLANGADVNQQSSFGATALTYAAYRGPSDPIVQLLLAHGARVGLIEALQFGDVDTVHRLLAETRGLKERGSRLETALMQAAQKGYVDIVQTLLARGANVNQRDALGRTALFWAVGCHPWGMLMRAEERQMGPKQERLTILQLLLSHGANVNVQGWEGDTALMWSCIRRDIALAQLLLAHGADANKRTRYNTGTALRYAAMWNDTALVNLLLDHGANIDAPDWHGDTILMDAIWSGAIDSVRVLLARGADINRKNRYGYTALRSAQEFRKKQIEELLRQAGAKE